MHPIFLSYASQDADAARRICDALRAAGLEVWFDQSELRGGDAWDASIRKQIKECVLFIPIISASTNARSEGYFRLEWKLAVDRSHLMADDQTFFLPVVIDDIAEPTARVPEKFRERQWSRLNDDVATNAFAERIAKLHGASAVSGTAVLTASPSGMGPGLRRDDDVGIVGKTEQAIPSIAVLAFANRSASADDEYFSDGLADELLNVLATIKGLRVSARASSFQFKGKSASPTEIGRALKVAHLLDGSVRKSGDRARIAVQLVDTGSGDQHWSQTFDRTLDDVFAVQDEIAQAVATALRVKLLLPVTGGDTASLGRTTNSDAHRERMQGKSLFQRGGYSARTAVPYFQRAVALDPNYAGAWADLSFALYWQSASGGGAGKVNNSHDYLVGFLAARDAAARANAIEPNLPEALSAQAALVRILDWNQTEAIALVRRAVMLSPNDASVLVEAAVVLRNNGLFDEASGHASLAVELDPISLNTYSALAAIEADRGHSVEAEALYRKAVALSTTDLFSPRFGLFVLLLCGERLDECAAMLTEWSIPLHRSLPGAMLAWAQGDVAHSDEQLDQVKREAAVLACYQIAQIHAYRQEPEATFDWLERCIEVRDPGVFNVKTDRLFGFLHADLRYATLIKRLGFS